LSKAPGITVERFLQMRKGVQDKKGSFVEFCVSVNKVTNDGYLYSSN